MKLVGRLLMRDTSELAHNPTLLVLVLVVPLLLLLLIGQLNVRPAVTRLAIVSELGSPPNSAKAQLLERLREIDSVQWVEWPAETVDLRERAVREGVDLVLVPTAGRWRAYSALTRSARVVPAQEVASLLILSMRREEQLRQQLRQLDHLVELLSASQQSAGEPPDGIADALASVRELQERAREDAALPMSLSSVWLAAQLTPLWAPASTADHALVPGFISLIAVFVPFVLASAALVREREAGTLAALLVVVRRRWLPLALGKVLFPVLAGLVAVALLLVAADLAFGFGIKPGLGTALLIQAVAAAVSATFGLAVSALIESAREAYAVSAIYLVALILLTGMVYPLEQSAPVVVGVAQLFPLSLAAPALETWMRAGASALELPWNWPMLGAQASSALLLCSVALRRLRARL